MSKRMSVTASALCLLSFCCPMRLWAQSGPSAVFPTQLGATAAATSREEEPFDIRVAIIHVPLGDLRQIGIEWAVTGPKVEKRDADTSDKLCRFVGAMVAAEMGQILHEEKLRVGSGETRTAVGRFIVVKATPQALSEDKVRLNVSISGSVIAEPKSEKRSVVTYSSPEALLDRRDSVPVELDRTIELAVGRSACVGHLTLPLRAGTEAEVGEAEKIGPIEAVIFFVTEVAQVRPADRPPTLRGDGGRKRADGIPAPSRPMIPTAEY